MHRPRIELYLRNAAFAAAALVWSAPFVVASPVFLLPARFGRPVAKAYLIGIAFLLRRICGLSFELRGRERLEQGPVLIAVSRQTAWDSLYLPMLLGTPEIVGEDGRLRNPLLRILSADSPVGGGRKILVFTSLGPTGSHPAAPLREDLANIYRTLGVACVPVAVNSARFWQFRSWLRHPGIITVEVLEPIAPGLDDTAFMTALTDRLTRATDRLMHQADPPALMAVPSLAARRLAASIREARPASPRVTSR